MRNHNRIGDAIAAAIMVQNQEATFSLLNSLTIGTVLKDQIKKNLMAALLNKEPRHWDVECAKVLTSLGCVLEDDLYDGDKDHSGENSTDAYPMYDCIEQDNVELMAYYLPFADPKIFKPADCFDGALGYGSIECLAGSLNNNHDVQATLNVYPMEWANAIVEGIEMTARSSNEKQEDGVNRNTTANISEIFNVLLSSTPPLFSQALEQKLLNFCLNNKNPLSALAEHAVLKNAAHPVQGASCPKVRI